MWKREVHIEKFLYLYFLLFCLLLQEPNFDAFVVPRYILTLCPATGRFILAPLDQTDNPPTPLKLTQVTLTIIVRRTNLTTHSVVLLPCGCQV